MKSSKKKQVKPQGSESDEVGVVPREDTPAKDWSLRKLLEHARHHLDEAKRLNGEAVALCRRSVKEFYQAGRILAIIREKLKPTHHSWVRWQRKNKLSRNRVNLAIRLFEAVRDPAELEAFKTIRGALRHYGIEKTPDETTPDETPTTADHQTDAAANRGDQNDAAGEQAEEVEDRDQTEEQKGEEQIGVPCLKGKIHVEKKSIKIEAGEISSTLLLPRSGVVRVVPRWRAELKRAVDGGDAVLIMPGLEVPDVAAG